MRKSSAAIASSLSVRIDLTPKAASGGKIQLLENVRTCGSISAAGRAMDMSTSGLGTWWTDQSYLPPRCIEGQAGGQDGVGAVLTPFGVSLVARYPENRTIRGKRRRKELHAIAARIWGSKKNLNGEPITNRQIRLYGSPSPADIASLPLPNGITRILPCELTEVRVLPKCHGNCHVRVRTAGVLFGIPMRRLGKQSI